MSYYGGEAIWERTADSRNRGMDRGVGFFRPRKLAPLQGEEAPAGLGAGETQAEVVIAAAVLAANGGLSLALRVAMGPVLLHRRTATTVQRDFRHKFWICAPSIIFFPLSGIPECWAQSL